MKTIHYIPFTSFFRPLYVVDNPQKDPFFFRERFAFNRFNLLKASLFCSFVLGFFLRGAWVFFLTEASLLLFLYLRTKQLAQALEVSRSAPLKAIEQDRISFKLVLRNYANFALSDCIVKDCFSGSTQSFFSAFIDNPIPPKSERVIQFHAICNGGMGKHFFGPVQVYVRDPFGIFNFFVRFEIKPPLDVYPKVFEIPKIAIKTAALSLNYGSLIHRSKGLSTNIQGVREYQPRDSIRHISWRLSAKRNQLMVKQFDHMVSANVIIALDLDFSHHVGQKADSTWEYSKDLANSIISQQVQEGNPVQLLTNNFFSESRKGEAHRNELIGLISKAKQIVDPDSRSLEERYCEFIQPDSTLIHIGPIYLKNSHSLIETLTQLRAQGTDILLYLMDPLSFSSDISHSTLEIAFQSLKEEFAYLEKLAFRGLEFKVLKKHRNVSTSLLEASS